MINQVCEEKDAALTTGQFVPTPKDGEELLNSEGTTESRTTNPPEPLEEQQDIDLKLKQWKDYILRGKLSEDEKKTK